MTINPGQSRAHYPTHSSTTKNSEDLEATNVQLPAMMEFCGLAGQPYRLGASGTKTFPSTGLSNSLARQSM